MLEKIEDLLHTWKQVETDLKIKDSINRQLHRSIEHLEEVVRRQEHEIKTKDELIERYLQERSDV